MRKGKEKNELARVQHPRAFLLGEPHPVLVGGVIISYILAIVTLLGLAEPVNATPYSPLSIVIVLAGSSITIFLLLLIQNNRKVKRLERQYTKTKQTLNRILAASNEVLIEVNQESEITLFNESAQELFGYHGQYIICKTISSLFPESHPQNQALYCYLTNQNIAGNTKNKTEDTPIQGYGIHRNKSVLHVTLRLKGANSSYFKGLTLCVTTNDSRVQKIPSPANTKKLHILLAEDNPINQKLASQLLEKAGHTVLVAETGEQAVELWQNNQIDIILMDIQMPCMDGYEATRIIRERAGDTHIPIIALTAHGFDSDRHKCIEAGMDIFLAKPLTREALFQAIDIVTQ